MKRALFLALCIGANLAYADAASDKQALVTKILKIQQPAIEALARGLAEQPAAQMIQKASAVLQTRIAPEQREAVAKKIQAELNKYADEATPIVTERAVKLAPTTIGKILTEKFTLKELKELANILESPVNQKFMKLGSDMQRALGEKLVEETRPQIEPKAKALEQAMAAHLGITPPPVTAETPPAK